VVLAILSRDVEPLFGGCAQAFDDTDAAARFAGLANIASVQNEPVMRMLEIALRYDPK
jgi:hypothetical protein